MGGPRFAAGTARLRPVLTPPVGGLSGEARSSSRLVALSYVRVQFSCRNCECRVRSNGVPMLQVSFVWGWNMGADDGWIVLSWPGSTSDDSPVMPQGCYFSTSTVLLAFTVGYTPGQVGPTGSSSDRLHSTHRWRRPVLPPQRRRPIARSV